MKFKFPEIHTFWKYDFGNKEMKDPSPKNVKIHDIPIAAKSVYLPDQ